MADSPKPPEPGNTSLRLGAAFLRPAKERDHYELVRPVITVRNEGDRNVTEAHPGSVPLAIYRLKRRGDDTPKMYDPLGPPPELKTMDQKTGQPLNLVLVWWPKMEEGEGAGE